MSRGIAAHLELVDGNSLPRPRQNARAHRRSKQSKSERIGEKNPA
jgi:hypothetical protein